ncbi:hypothetical protein V6N13_063094 [Hibiscus sabdariffa]|uniref:Ubiquitin receptor RAD23 n=1 Tax=Hibiscus sabdariffa TaxID=183260 RepID=A0ABR2C471_9ROSI
MKLTVKTLKGSHFEIRAHPNYTVMAVKKTIEDIQGKDKYPCGQQLLIHNGKVLKDETTLADNKVSEDGFLVVMLRKSKPSGSAGASSAQHASSTAPASNPTPTSDASSQAPASKGTTSTSDAATANPSADTYSEDASLRAAYNNPERAVDYLYSGIPESAEMVVPMAHFPTSQSTEASAAPVSGAPNSSPFNMFPPETLSGAGAGAGAGGLESFDFLRNNQRFQALRSMIQSNPQILRPMLRELGMQNLPLLRQIQEHREEFLEIINESPEGSEGDILDQAEEDMHLAIDVTPTEQEAIQRLEAMGFERALVIEAFLACDRDEELAANYLLENAGDSED